MEGLTHQPMPKLGLKERIKSFKEVSLGYTREQAMAEAGRCLQCREPRCVKGCPIGVDIPGFIELVGEGRFEEAIERLRERNSLPAITGRVCPQEYRCQARCVLGRRGDPMDIAALERFVADRELEGGVRVPGVVASAGGRVAIIGSGPAGLTASAELAKLGHDVTILEGLHRPGGVLVYGIPEFRLPKRIVEAEVRYVKRLGVRIRTDVVVGRTVTLDDLLEGGFDAVFIATGAGLPRFLGIPGENLCGIYSANEFLIRINLMRAYGFPDYDTPVKVGKRAVVIGGGNVAIDAARAAVRLGAEEVLVVYRRTEREMPARLVEIRNAKEEGVRFLFLAAPVSFLGERGWVRGVRCVRMRLGELDASGRPRPIPVEGSEFLIGADTVVIAIGQKPNATVLRAAKGIEVTEGGTIVADPETQETSLRGVYAGGDVVTGDATVISAMGAGRRAARAIHGFLMRHSP